MFKQYTYTKVPHEVENQRASAKGTSQNNEIDGCKISEMEVVLGTSDRVKFTPCPKADGVNIRCPIEQLYCFDRPEAKLGHSAITL